MTTVPGADLGGQDPGPQTPSFVAQIFRADMILDCDVGKRTKLLDLHLEIVHNLFAVIVLSSEQSDSFCERKSAGAPCSRKLCTTSITSTSTAHQLQ